MKGKIQYKVEGRTVEREVNYVPVRFILAIALAVLETVTIVAIVIALSYYVPYFHLAVLATEIACVIKIIASEDNPVNLDYRSLVHNFENGVWMYRCDCLKDIRQDFADTLETCIRIDETKIKWSLVQRFVRSVVKVFTPML